MEWPGCLDAEEECKGPVGVGVDMLVVVADYCFGIRAINIACAFPQRRNDVGF